MRDRSLELLDDRPDGVRADLCRGWDVALPDVGLARLRTDVRLEDVRIRADRHRHRRFGNVRLARLRTDVRLGHGVGRNPGIDVRLGDERRPVPADRADLDPPARVRSGSRSRRRIERVLRDVHELVLGGNRGQIRGDAEHGQAGVDGAPQCGDIALQPIALGGHGSVLVAQGLDDRRVIRDRSAVRRCLLAATEGGGLVDGAGWRHLLQLLPGQPGEVLDRPQDGVQDENGVAGVVPLGDIRQLDRHQLDVADHPRPLFVRHEDGVGVGEAELREQVGGELGGHGYILSAAFRAADCWSLAPRVGERAKRMSAQLQCAPTVER